MASLALDILQEFAGLNGFFETGRMAGKAGHIRGPVISCQGLVSPGMARLLPGLMLPGMAGKAGFIADKGREKIGRGWTVRFLAGIGFPCGLKELL